MNEILLLKGNPSRRKSRKRRSSAQRAATKRMLAANRSRFHSNPRKRRKSRKSASAAPVVHRRRSSPRKAHRRVSRRAGRSFGGGSNIVSLLKNGAIMGGGALVADVGMGLIAKFVPTMPQLTAKLNADGSVNYGYYATKLGIIYAMSKYGSRVSRHAGTAAAGALAVVAYELISSFVPKDGSIPLGYFNPGRIVTGGNLGRIQRLPGNMNSGGIQNNNLGRIMSLPAGAGKGAVASATIRNLAGRR